MEGAVLIAKAEIRRAAAHEKLKQSGVYDELGNRLVTGPPEPIVVRNDDSILFKYLETANALADTVGVPEVDVHHATSGASSTTSAPKLSKIIDEWRRLKKTGRGDKDTRHVKEATRIFKQFIRVIGNNPIDGLNASQFAAWREWVLNAAVKRASGKWSNDRHAIVKQVIRFVRRHRCDWPWPDGLSDARLTAAFSTHSRHVKEATRIFKQFIRVIGNNPIDGLNASQFAAWREWVLNAAVHQ